ncbi:CapA family protein [candidate division WOR-3 bacterium]|nr:CapA family protein [candidate division WOR-3 bacterium]
MTDRTALHTAVILLLFCSLGNGGSVTVIAVGDIMMGSDFPASRLPPDQGSGLFTNVADILRSADLTLGNLEGVLLDGGVCAKNPSKGKVYAFRTPTSYARYLADAGFDFLNLANNHMNDFGLAGIQSTKESLEALGIEYGGPEGRTGTFRIVRMDSADVAGSTDSTGRADSAGNVVSADTLRVSIACFATSPGADLIFDIKKAQQKVAGLARDNDIVIVSFHGGAEGLGCLHTRDTFEYFLGTPRGNVVAFARAVVDSGADLVWGHGPHVPRAMEMYKDRLIAYSLGNFCTYGFNISGELGYAPILKAVLDTTGVFMHGEIISALQTANQPLIVDSLHRAARLIARLSAEDFPLSAPQITEEGIILLSGTDPEEKAE